MCRYPTASEVSKPQPQISLPLEEKLSLLTNHDLQPIQAAQQSIITTDDLPPIITKIDSSLEDTLSSEPVERSTTPPPPVSSPPSLSPVKADDSCDPAEQWNEPRLIETIKFNINHDDNVDGSCSSLDTEQLNSEDIFNEIDQSANDSQLSATIAKEMHDSLGTLSSLSEDIITVSIN